MKFFWGRKPDIYHINKSVEYIDRIIKAVFDNEPDPLLQQAQDDVMAGKIMLLEDY